MFYETNIIIIPKPDKEVRSSKNYWPISQKHRNIFNKILINEIQQYIYIELQPQSCEIYNRDAILVQHSKHNQCNPYRQSKGKKII